MVVQRLRRFGNASNHAKIGSHAAQRQRIRMRGFFLTIVVAGVVGITAAAEPATAAPASAVPSGPLAASFELVANVCGRNGCVAVQTKRVVHTKPGSVAAKHI
jgi:hypothetical protein